MASGITVGFKTKQTLQSEHIKLTKEIIDFRRRYENIYRVVGNLSETYRSCRHHIPLRRYWELKNMIRACVTESDVVLQEHARYGEENGEPANLFNNIKKWSCTAADLSMATNEVLHLHKAEIVAGIEEKERKIHELEQKLEHLRLRLNNLKPDYERYKRNFPTTRYRRMKQMIKPLINDERLRVDW